MIDKVQKLYSHEWMADLKSCTCKRGSVEPKVKYQRSRFTMNSPPRKPKIKLGGTTMILYSLSH
jgi:hypothetical protein